MNWFRQRFVEPNRRQVCDAIDKLKPLPEADRMRTKPRETPKRRQAPRTIEEWQQRHGKRTA
jgi:hypothetical protein